MQVCYCKIMPETGVNVPPIERVAPIINIVGTAVGVGETARFVTDELTGSKRSILRKVRERLPGGKTQQATNNPGQNPHPFAPAKVAPVEATGPTVRFATHQFKDTLSNMPAISENGRERATGVTPAEYVEFSKEFVDGMRGFAESYVQKLINMNRTVDMGGRRVNLYEEMKRVQAEIGQAYVEDDYMLDLFAPADAQTGVRKLKSPAEINTLISTDPEIIQNLMVAAERYARDVFAAAGIRAEMRGEGHRSDLTDLPYTFDFPIDQGPLNVAVRRFIDWLDAPTNRGGRGNAGLRRYQAIAGTTVPGAWVGAGAGAAVAGPIGALAGGAAGVAFGPVVAATIRRLAQNGVRLTMVRDQGVLGLAQRPGEWMRGVYLLGIDSHDRARSTGRESALQQATQIVYLRAEYMRGLRVPPQQLDALSEQFLNVPGQTAEHTDETMRNEIMQRFRELGGWDHRLSLMDQREIYRRAQEKAMIHRFEQLIAKGQTSTVNEVDRLNQAIAARRVGEGGVEGPILAARKREDTERKQKLTEDRTSLEGKGTTLISYQQKLEAARNAEQAVDGFISEISRTGVAAPPGNFDEAIRWLTETMTIPGTAATMVPDENGRLVPVPALADRVVQLANNKAAEIAAIPVPPAGRTDPAYLERVGGINRKYEPLEQQITELRNIVQGAIRRLRALDRTAANARQEALASQETTNASTTLAEFNQAFIRLYPTITAAAAAGAGINYETLIREINNLGIWPPEDNDLPENRLLIHQALAQNNAAYNMQINIPNHNILYASFMTATQNPVIAQRISAEQLRALSVEELYRRANQVGIPQTAARDRIIREAQEYAAHQFEYTQRAIQEENRIIQGQETVLERRIRNVNPENEIAQLEMVKAIKEDDVKARAVQTWIDTDKRSELEDEALINAYPQAARAQGYTDAEIKSRAPRNILEILHILTGYQDDPDRAGRFQQITRDIDLDTLVVMLNRSFAEQLRYSPDPPGSLPLPPGATNVQVFARRFRNSTQANSINGANFGRSMKRLIAEFNAWSRTI